MPASGWAPVATWRRKTQESEFQNYAQVESQTIEARDRFIGREEIKTGKGKEKMRISYRPKKTTGIDESCPAKNPIRRRFPAPWRKARGGRTFGGGTAQAPHQGKDKKKLEERRSFGGGVGDKRKRKCEEQEAADWFLQNAPQDTHRGKIQGGT